MIRGLDIDIIAPQHGAVFGTPELSRRFIDWAEDLECGLDLMSATYTIPG
jgi:flavorubredoxin